LNDRVDLHGGSRTKLGSTSSIGQNAANASNW